MAVRDYQQCTQCVMDTTDPNITFDENGVCHHCNYYPNKVKEMVISGNEGINYITKLFDKIKKKNCDKRYDCLLGVSGGADSSFVAYLVHKYKLRVLLVHFDNGYNTPEGYC